MHRNCDFDHMPYNFSELSRQTSIDTATLNRQKEIDSNMVRFLIVLATLLLFFSIIYVSCMLN